MRLLLLAAQESQIAGLLAGVLFVIATFFPITTESFQIPPGLLVVQRHGPHIKVVSSTSSSSPRRTLRTFPVPTSATAAVADDNDNDGSSNLDIGFARADTSKIVIDLTTKQDNSASKSSSSLSTTAADPAGAAAATTNTINDRLLAELQEAERKERFGARSAAGKKMGLVDGFGRRRKSDKEIEMSIAEARDLNGVNPIVAILGSFFALAVAAGLWIATNQLGGWFATHPPDTEIYFVMRSAQVFRNVVVGMIALASGFFGVTGLGIFLLGVRVAYGVATGELDPTPIAPKVSSTKQNESSVNMGSMIELMMNKRPSRRGGGGSKKDNDLFGN